MDEIYFKALMYGSISPYEHFDYSRYIERHTSPPDVVRPVMSSAGYHVVVSGYISQWLEDELWEVTPIGEMSGNGIQYACQSIRFVRRVVEWNATVARVFACWCARQLFEYLDDDFDKEAVEIAERHAYGKATEDELNRANNITGDHYRNEFGNLSRLMDGDTKSPHYLEDMRKHAILCVHNVTMLNPFHAARYSSYSALLVGNDPSKRMVAQNDKLLSMLGYA